ncbi:hypothetical protein FA95DRAFT_1578926, partial [Auriscalpium vulgare]
GQRTAASRAPRQAPGPVKPFRPQAPGLLKPLQANPAVVHLKMLHSPSPARSRSASVASFYRQLLDDSRPGTPDAEEVARDEKRRQVIRECEDVVDDRQAWDAKYSRLMGYTEHVFEDCTDTAPLPLPPPSPPPPPTPPRANAPPGDDEITPFLRSEDDVRAHLARYGFRKHTATATDAYGIAQLAGRDAMWISSPNMDFVPALPCHSLTKEFGYYADGMLGPFEYLKWPQALDSQEPHSMAAPLNPFLFRYSDAFTDCPQFPRREDGIVWRAQRPPRRVPELDVFPDDAAAWFSFTSNEWSTDPFAVPECGTLAGS